MKPSTVIGSIVWIVVCANRIIIWFFTSSVMKGWTESEDRDVGRRAGDRFRWSTFRVWTQLVYGRPCSVKALVERRKAQRRMSRIISISSAICTFTASQQIVFTGLLRDWLWFDQVSTCFEYLMLCGFILVKLILDNSPSFLTLSWEGYHENHLILAAEIHKSSPPTE